MTCLSLLTGTPGSNAKQEDEKKQAVMLLTCLHSACGLEQRRELLEPDDSDSSAHWVSVGKVNHKFECAEILLSGASLGGMFGAVLLVFPVGRLQNIQLFFIVV